MNPAKVADRESTSIYQSLTIPVAWPLTFPIVPYLKMEINLHSLNVHDRKIFPSTN